MSFELFYRLAFGHGGGEVEGGKERKGKAVRVNRTEGERSAERERERERQSKEQALTTSRRITNCFRMFLYLFSFLAASMELVNTLLSTPSVIILSYRS